MNKRILVIDDEEDVLKVLGMRLADAGYAVVRASCGREGLRAARQERPDLILLDVNMPDIGGGEVSEALRSDPETRDIPIIYLTALVTKGEAARRTACGDRFIAKPYDPEELLAEVRKALPQVLG